MEKSVYKLHTCEDLIKEIKNRAEELKKRKEELKKNIHNLPPTGKNSIQGHITQFYNIQIYLKKLIVEFNFSNCCGNDKDWFKEAQKYISISHDQKEDFKEIEAINGLKFGSIEKIALGFCVTTAVIASVLSAPAVAVIGIASSLMLMYNSNPNQICYY
jgi:sugar-specific transcriptional regulator TrmB